jgi:hypothetical protein
MLGLSPILPNKDLLTVTTGLFESEKLQPVIQAAALAGELIRLVSRPCETTLSNQGLCRNYRPDGSLSKQLEDAVYVLNPEIKDLDEGMHRELAEHSLDDAQMNSLACAADLM